MPNGFSMMTRRHCPVRLANEAGLAELPHDGGEHRGGRREIEEAIAAGRGSVWPVSPSMLR